MQKLRVVLVLALAVATSSAQANRADSSWVVGSKWQFTIVDRPSNKPTRATFIVESDDADSCLAGEWKKLRMVGGSYKGVSEPAYVLEGNHLTVLLTSDICDSYDKVEGEIKSGQFLGRHSWFGIAGGKDVGNVTAIRVH